ncbi:hypothetical protein [Listeria costaricensis]|uniref:hypothetical protein n=1 Tax=Listeria costaricensis TaxID=2026604 RepID=UPI000C08B946|nr:hypothetical protein [Listeria costaricensis]
MSRTISILFFIISFICIFFPWLASGIDENTWLPIYPPAYQMLYSQPILIIGYLGSLVCLAIPHFKTGTYRAVPFVALLILVLGLFNLGVQVFIELDIYNFAGIELYFTKIVQPAFLIAGLSALLSWLSYLLYLKKHPPIN